MNSKTQIGCWGEDARFISCSGCLHKKNVNRCYETRKEGNLVLAYK